MRAFWLILLASLVINTLHGQRLSLEQMVVKIKEGEAKKVQSNTQEFPSGKSKPLLTYRDNQDFNKSELALFCKMEDQIASQSKVLLKFRIGPVSMLDRLEGYNRSLLAPYQNQSLFYFPANRDP